MTRPRRLTARIGAIAAAITVSALALAGCAGGDASASAGGGGEDVLKMTYISYLPMTTLSTSIEMLADTGGYFTKHGLDVEFQVVKGAGAAIPALIGGQTPVTKVGMIDALTAADEGQPLVQVGTIERGGAFQIVSDKKDPITTLDDLEGKVIGLSSIGGTSEKTLRLALKDVGLDLKQIDSPGKGEVGMTVVGSGPADFANVQNGRIAAYMVGIDIATIVAKQFGDEAVIASGLTSKVQADSQVYVATKDSLEKNAEVIKRFLAATTEAKQALLDDETLDDSVASLQSGYSFPSLDDAEVAKQSIDQLRARWTIDGEYPSLENETDRFVSAYGELKSNNLLKAGDGDPAEWVTNDYLP
ncbi:ABC transporter substrate-binding protein [Microbacterium sp. BWT-B31]|uniref:ABC transporter substrate-binding protein n=1 Tax=Microbacterium sp. BWT-B31 TaxID=3232072 RepID=UPI0035283804